MGSRGHWNTNPDVYQFASTWEVATCGGNSTAVGQLHTNVSWEWEVKMNSVLNTGLPGIKDKDSEMSICLWLWRTWNNYTVSTWIYNYSQIRGVKMQLATSLTPIDAPGSPGRTKFIPLRCPQIFFFLFRVFGVYFPHLTLHLLVLLQPWLTHWQNLICSFFLFHVIVYKNPKSTQNTFPTL